MTSHVGTTTTRAWNHCTPIDALLFYQRQICVANKISQVGVCHSELPFANIGNYAL